MVEQRTLNPQVQGSIPWSPTSSPDRGMPVKAFTSVDAAEQWLLTQRDGANEKNLFEENNSRDPFR